MSNTRQAQPDTKLDECCTSDVSAGPQWRHLLADLLMDGLREVFCIDNGPDLPGRVRCPERRRDLNLRLAAVNPGRGDKRGIKMGDVIYVHRNTFSYH